MTGVRVFFFIRIGFIFLGIVFLAIGLGVSRNRAKKQQSCTQLVRAVITDVVCERTYSTMDHSHSETWYPIYEYTAGNEQIRERSHVGGLKKDYQIGTKVTLMVNPENVRQFYRPDDHLHLIVRIFCLLGGGMLVVGLGLWFFEKRFLRF